MPESQQTAKNTISSFEDLLVWQKAEGLCLLVYKAFASSSDYSYRDQIRRASVSIMNNIAEGYERKGNKEYCRFLFIAKGSCGEVRSMLHLGLKLKYINREEYENLLDQTVQISKMLYGLIKKL
ncbi:MAG: four helix bundle protein [Candidatus Berkelbacteria bacterium]|nr:four helix bundle protein [Candidatus Berkelbacteria bacterium]